MGITECDSTSATSWDTLDLSPGITSGSTDAILSVNMVLCACGCGQEITWKAHYKWQGIPKYVHGHNPSWNKGKQTGDTWMKGKHHTAESNHKNRLAHLGKPLKHAAQFKKGQTPWNKGMPLSIEWKHNLSNSLQGRVSPNKSKKFPEYSGKNHPHWNGGKKLAKARMHYKRNLRGFILLTNKNPYNEPIEYHHIHPDLAYVVPCPARIHKIFMGKNHYQNVNAMLGFKSEVN